MVNFKQAVFIKSAPSITDAPDLQGSPEVLMLGRSNVGKSSLINALVSRKGLAKTSNTPGKTRLMNYFWIDEKIALVDLPGYGYAKVSKSQQQQWQKEFERYMREREEIKLTLLLVDGRHGPQPSDIQMYDWLMANDLPVKIILTKLDKVKKAQRAKQIKLTVSELEINPDDVLPFSTEENIQNGGVFKLQQLLKDALLQPA